MFAHIINVIMVIVGVKHPGLADFVTDQNWFDNCKNGYAL